MRAIAWERGQNIHMQSKLATISKGFWRSQLNERDEAWMDKNLLAVEEGTEVKHRWRITKVRLDGVRMAFGLLMHVVELGSKSKQQY